MIRNSQTFVKNTLQFLTTWFILRFFAKILVDIGILPTDFLFDNDFEGGDFKIIVWAFPVVDLLVFDLPFGQGDFEDFILVDFITNVSLEFFFVDDAPKKSCALWISIELSESGFSFWIAWCSLISSSSISLSGIPFSFSSSSSLTLNFSSRFVL